MGRSKGITRFVMFFVMAVGALAAGRVDWKRVPDGGIQPQVAVGRDGTVHLVFFKGDPEAGDLYYARSRDGETFSDPVRVNSEAGTAVAVGNIRGARVAVGRGGRVYVAWNGSKKTGAPSEGRNPMLFARSNETGTGFEAERNLIERAYGVDGGGGLAADGRGRVYVFWHAPQVGQKGEAARRVWMRRSGDDGRTFARERVVFEDAVGTCGCCSLDAFADRAGEVYVLFRAAEALVHRDMYLLESKDGGTTFHGADISKWDVGYCVMSSEALAEGRTGTLAAWETEKKIHLGRIAAQGTGLERDEVVEAHGANQKYPAIAANGAGDLLVAWTEGMGWKRGGLATYRLWEKTGEGGGGTAMGVPAWSLVAAYARRDGGFVVMY